MIRENGGWCHLWPPVGSPVMAEQQEEHLVNFGGTMHAVSFGFVATAILISMFLVMAIFERFLRPTSRERTNNSDVESQAELHDKLGHPSPNMVVYNYGVSVVMPGENMPTFIGHPAPLIHLPEPISISHKQFSRSSPNANLNSNASAIPRQGD